MEKYLEMWINGEYPLSKLCKIYKISLDEFIEYAKTKGYYIQGRTTSQACIRRKKL